MGKRWLAAAAITFVGCLAFGQTAKTATQKSDVDRAIDLLFATRSFDQVAISPDGSQIAWVEMLREARGEPSLNSAIYLANTAGAKPRQITAGAGAAGKEREVMCAPDSKNFVATAAKGEGDANWWMAQLYIVAADNGTMKSIYQPKLQMGRPRWSRDGKWIAFISGIMSDEDSVGGDVFVAPAQGGDARNLTDGMRASAASVQWLDSGKILVTEIADGGAAMATVSPGDATVQNLWSGAETIASEHEQDSGISLSRDGTRSAVIRNSFL